MTRLPLFLTGLAPGFEETEWPKILLKPGTTATLTMNPTPPTTGQITAAADGYPVPGAKLRLLRRQGGLGGAWNPDDGPLLATADEEGQFRLDTLRRDTRYAFYVEAPGFRREILRGITAGQGPLKIAMGPRLAVSGRVLAPELAGHYDGKPYISFRQDFTDENFTSGGMEQNVELIVRDGVGYFEYSRLWPGEVTIIAGKVSKTLKLKESVKDLTFDLRPQSGARSKAPKAVTTATTASGRR
jgi:hypothetical protein